MFITRATRHDHADIEALLSTRDWGEQVDLKEGVTFIARDGGVVGCLRLVEVAPQTVVVDNVLVHEDKRGNGIGSSLMRAAMNSRGGTLYLCCHDDRIPFYERLGFGLLPGGFDDAPGPVQDYWRRVGDYPTAPDHEHFFLRAR